jgi:hypothetical protein
LDDYVTYELLARHVVELGESKFVTASSLGRTIGGREIHLLTVGVGEVDQKPAILVVGNIHAPQLVGSELALRFALKLSVKAASDENVAKMLDRVTFYIIPQPSPDATAKCFAAPFWEHTGNVRETDDDRDGDVGEDPPDDLNGDGWITMMRVADDTGEFMPHPDDPRVLIKADAVSNERGQYRLFVEGRDDDGDEQFNEDGAEGVALNRNFPFRYAYFGQQAGPHQVSEVESRAIADFAFNHPNIALVFTFTPQDNLMNPWKTNAAAERERIKTTLLSEDAPYQDFLANNYQKIHSRKDAPESPAGEGSFSDWAYFHYGRWSLAARPWWIPQGTAGKKQDDAQNSGEKRGADEVRALRWFDEQGINAFVDWTAFDHSDFPGKRVEVGGLKPFYRLNPPASEINALADKYYQFLTELTGLLPRVEIHETKLDSLGGGVFRITASVANHGYLPTMPEMGRITGQAYPLQIQLDLPQPDTHWIQGSPRAQLNRLSGNGGKAEQTWIVRLPNDKPAGGKIKVWAPAVGSHEVLIELKASEP